MRLMNVAVDCRYIRERPSGIGVYVQALVDRLPRDAPSDRFVFWRNPRAAPRLSAARNVEEVTIGPRPNSPLTALWPARYARFDNVDVFHNPHNILPRGIPCATVVTLHDVLAIDHPPLHRRGFERLIKSVYYPQAVWRAIRQADRLIVPSEATADRVRAIAPGAAPRIRVVANAADPCFAPARDVDASRRQAAALVGADAPYFLVVGENSATKRHDVALVAFAAAAPPPWRLVLVQRLGARARLTRLAHRLRVADRVVWLRNVSRADIVALTQAAAALLQPSVYEGFGLPVLEAMACGCPVVASDIPALREVAGEAAVLVAPGEPAALADALRALMASPGRRQELAGAGLARARDFSWDRSVRTTVEIYREAMAASVAA